MNASFLYSVFSVISKIILLIAFLLFSLPRATWSTEVSLTPLTTGHFKANFKYMVAGGKSEEVKLPIPFYVIRHPQGIVLFDSGLALEFPDQVNGWWLHRWMQKMLPYEFSVQDSAVEQLKKRGIPPEQVRFIILSHLHYDHSSGVQDFPQAKVVLSKNEWENSKVGRWRALMRGIMLQALKGVESRLWLVDYSGGKPWGPFESSYDLFGDGSLLLLSTPGHTPGSQSLLAMLGSGKKVLLTGDAVWVRENYLLPAPKSWLIRNFEENRKKAWETTLKIRQFHEQNPDAVIIPGHDPHLWGELPESFR